MEALGPLDFENNDSFIVLLKAIVARDPENEDGFKFVVLFSKESSRLLDLDPENDDSFRFSQVGSKDCWKMLEDLGPLDPENNETMLVYIVFNKDSWKLLDP